MQVVNRPPATAQEEIIDAAFYVLDPAELKQPTRHIAYPLATLKALSPEQWALMELRDGADLAILQKCYSAFSPLSSDWLDFRRELDMTNDKDLFIEKYAPGLLPLYQGKTIWQYSHQHDAAQYWLDAAAFDQRLTSKELYRMAQDLKVPKSEVAKYAKAVRYDRDFVRLGFREIARDTDERTLIFSLIPKNVGVGHKVNISVPKTYVRSANDGAANNGAANDGATNNGTADDSAENNSTTDDSAAAKCVTTQAVSSLRLLFALAWFNSVPTDWLARFMIQISVSQTYLYRLPMPQPTDAEIRATPDFAQLAKNALLLSLAANWDDFAELAPLFEGVERKNLPQTAKAQDQLRAQNDRIVARLYGITGAELAHLLRSFKVMASKRPEYLTLLA